MTTHDIYAARRKQSEQPQDVILSTKTVQKEPRKHNITMPGIVYMRSSGYCLGLWIDEDSHLALSWWKLHSLVALAI